MTLSTNGPGNFIVYRWDYPDAAARTTDTGFVTADLGSLARQLDDDTLWMLTATAPTWQAVGSVDLSTANTWTAEQTVDAGSGGGNVALTTSGDVVANAADPSGGTPSVDSPYLILRSSFWDGATGQWESAALRDLRSAAAAGQHALTLLLDTASAGLVPSFAVQAGGRLTLVAPAVAPTATPDAGTIFMWVDPTSHKLTYKTQAGTTYVLDNALADGSVTEAKLSFDPATQAELDTHAALTTTAHGGIVASTDSRLTDSRTPTSHVHAAADVTSGVLAIARLATGTPTGAKFVRDDGTLAVPAGTGGAGTVTSVALTLPADLSIAGSPVTTSGTLAITRATQTANKVLASATSGGAAVPDYRALVAADIPAIAESGVTSLTGDLALKAPLASPTFTGTPAAPTAAGGTNTTQLATTAFVTTAVAGGLGGAPTAHASSHQSGGSDPFTGVVPGSSFAPSGLTGATAASRYVGATASGAPVSGTFAVGDFVLAQTGKVYICTTAGTPGTWTQAGTSAGGLTLIAETLLTGTAASIDFSSIPGTYRHLLLVGSLRGTAAAAFVDVLLRCNADSGANYQWQYIDGAGAGAAAARGTAQTAITMADVPANTATANVFGQLDAMIAHYANSTNKKTVASRNTYLSTHTDIQSILWTGSWFATPAAINQLTVLPSAGLWAIGCLLSLYGVS